MRRVIGLIVLLIGLNYENLGSCFFWRETTEADPSLQISKEYEDVVTEDKTNKNGKAYWTWEEDFLLPWQAAQDQHRRQTPRTRFSDAKKFSPVSFKNYRITFPETRPVVNKNSATTSSSSDHLSRFWNSTKGIYALVSSGLPTTRSPFYSATLVTNTPYPCMYGVCNGTCCRGDFAGDYFDCSNGQKINKSLVCNRENDCADGSDESICSPWPPKITVLPKQEVEVFCGDQEKEKSGTLTLECQSVGHPTPLIRWKKYDGHVPSKCQQYSKRGHGILTCPNFEQSDQGAYSCVAENSVKMAESQPKSTAKCSNTINCKGFRVVNSEGIEHCLECYCSGKTSRCQNIKSNSTMITFPFPESKTEIFAAENGEILFIPTKSDLTPSDRVRQSTQEITYCTLTESNFEETSFLKSFGRNILIPRYRGKKNFLAEAPDLLIRGNGVSLMYKVNLISPPKESFTYTSARFWPGNWHHINKSPATREDLMKVLSNVDTLFIRCEYTQGTFVTWNETANISLETSVITDFATSVSYVEKCFCPTGYDGLSCESCAAGYKKKSQGNDFICEKTNIPTPCEEGYTGAKCDVCDAVKGYIRKDGGNLCVKPTCHPDGSISFFFDFSGTCTCKVGVSGNFCDECTRGYFYLNKAGCEKCWCSGVTNQCKSSNLYRAVISNTPRGGYNSSDGRNFWLLPSDFSGNRLTSYGGQLNYTMKYKPGIPKENTQLTVEFLSVDDVTLIYTHPSLDRSTLRDDKSWSVPITETNWRKSDRSSVSRGEFLTVLSKIKAVYIESPYHLSSGQVNLTSTRMSTASVADSYDAELALAVEQCSCPTGYTGLSCESCSEGYYKKRNGTITQCIKCNCSNCDPEFGCPDCPELTYRDNPEEEKIPICKPCPCNGNGVSCVKDDLNQIFCRCKVGFTGMHCENIVPNETEEFTVSIFPRKIRGKRVGTAVSLNCSFSGKESMILSAEKSYNTQRNSSLAKSLSHSGAVTDEKGKTTKSFEVVLDDGLAAVKCSVHDAAGNLAGCVVAVVEDLITITKPVKIKNCYSDRIDLKESESRDIICEATGSPRPVVNWYKSVNGTVSEVDTTAGVHSIESASLRDNGTIYTCIAENAEGDKASCTKVLIVRKKCEVINIFPKAVRIEEMENTTIQCKTTAKSSVTWSMLNSSSNEVNSIFSNRIKESKGYLHITNAQVSDSGTYICSAMGENGPINKTISVIVEEKKVPPVATIQEYDKVLKADETFVITCLGKGKPSPTIHWKKLNGALDRNVYVRENTLMISRATPQNSGIYQCEARSSLGNATDYISVEVEELKHAPRVNVSVENIKGHEGEEVTVSCLAIGYPRPKLYWLAPGVVHFTTVSSTNDSMVVIAPQEFVKEEISFKITKEMEGSIITCSAENVAGKSEKEVKIKVLQFQGGVNETVEFVPIGSYFELTCDIIGDVKWKKVGGLVGDECFISNDLMITSVQRQHNGTYVCTANSSYKKIINLIVVGFVPKFSNLMRSFLVLPVTQRSSRELRVEMSFNPTSENGLLLRKDNNKFDVYLKKGHVHLRIYSNDGDSLDIKMKSPIHLRKWFSLVVTIDRNYVDITVYNEKMAIHDRKTESSRNFEIGHGNDSFFVGGYLKQRHPMGLFFPHVPHFDGCISRLSIDGHEYDMVKEGSYSQNVTLCRKCFEEKNLCGERGKCFDAPTQYGFICVCPNDQESKATCPHSCVGKGCETQLDLCGLLKPCTTAFSFSNKCTNNMYSLRCACAYGYAGTVCEKVQQYSFCANGNGFVRLPSDVLERRLGEREIIKMAFTLTKPDGQLLWQGDKSNYLSIAVVDGKLKYEYLNQYSKLSVQSHKLEMDKRHNFWVKRLNETVIMEVNGATQSGNSSDIYRSFINKYYTNRVAGDIYLGNVPNNTFHTPHVGLHGCIHQVSFGDKSKINLPEKELEEFNVYQVVQKLSPRSSYESDESEYTNDLDSDYPTS